LFGRIYVVKHWLRYVLKGVLSFVSLVIVRWTTLIFGLETIIDQHQHLQIDSTLVDVSFMQNNYDDVRVPTSDHLLITVLSQVI